AGADRPRGRPPRGAKEHPRGAPRRFSPGGGDNPRRSPEFREEFMARFALTTSIAAPVDRVFALSTDVEGWPGRIKGITKVEKLTPGPVAAGTRFRETRVMFGKAATEEMEFTRFEPNAAYALGCESCGASYLCTFTFRPEDGGTRLTVECDCRPRSFFARLLLWPLSLLMRGMMKKCIQKDLDDLKAAAERTRQNA